MAHGNDSIGKHFGNYRVIAELARGLYSSLYLAQHIFLPRHTVAIKLRDAEESSTVQEQGIFLKEAQLLDTLQHPHILHVIDIGIDANLPFLITEYAPNGSLRERLEHQLHCPLPLEEALTILSQVGQAVQYAHQQNIIHCDLKPESILFNREGSALLAGFGSATMLTDTISQTNQAPGSIHYTAPEQFEGTMSKEGDQYSLGCIAYELFTGYQPFTDLSLRAVIFKHMTQAPMAPTQLNAQIPAHIEAAILKALAKQRTDRYPDIHAFLTALGASSILQPPASVLALSTSPTGEQMSDTTTAPKTKEQWLDEGQLLYNRKCYTEALAAYEHALGLDPYDTYIYIGKGLALCELGRYEESLALFEHAIELDPSDTYAYIGKGCVFRMQQRHEDALASYEQAILLDTSDADAHLGKGLILEQIGHYQDALLSYEEAIVCSPDNIAAWQSKAHMLQLLDRTEEAQQTYERIHQLITIAEMRKELST